MKSKMALSQRSRQNFCGSMHGPSSMRHPLDVQSIAELEFYVSLLGLE